MRSAQDALGVAEESRARGAVDIAALAHARVLCGTRSVCAGCGRLAAGAGGGGAGHDTTGVAGTANTGGGGGGIQGTSTSGAGGSGVVIIRYKYK